MSGKQIDLGFGHTIEFTAWHPDRALNPQYAALPDVDPEGAILRHELADGSLCEGALTFDSPVTRQLRPSGSFWEIVSLEPLTLTPSSRCHCGDHGFIREGRWVPA